MERRSIWCFEQEQSLGGSNVSNNVRMIIIKLRSGGLFVHAPIAATKYVSTVGIDIGIWAMQAFDLQSSILDSKCCRKGPS